MGDLPRLLLCSFDVVPSPTGASRRVTEYLKGLSDRFQVVVLSVKTPDHSHIERVEGARLLRVPVGNGDFASRLEAFDRAVRRQVDSEEYALVHCLDPFAGHTVSELKPHHAYKLVYEAERFPSQELPATHPGTALDRRLLAKARRQELFCLMNADLVLTGSQVTKGFIHSLGVPERALRLIRAPADVPAYAAIPAARAETTPPLRVFHLAGRAAFEDVDTVLDAVRRANAETAVELVVLGAPPAEGPWVWQTGVSSRGLEQRVELRRAVPHAELPAALADADACLVPLADVERNRVQGTPVAQLSEYFAAGRAVIAADLPSVRERLPETCGVFYPPGDAAALASRLVELARDGERRAGMGRSARSAASELDGTKARAELAAAYESLLGALEVSDSAHGTDAVTSTGTGRRRVDSDTQRRKIAARRAPAKAPASVGRPAPPAPPMTLAPSGALLPPPRSLTPPLAEKRPAAVTLEAPLITDERHPPNGTLTGASAAGHRNPDVAANGSPSRPAPPVPPGARSTTPAGLGSSAKGATPALGVDARATNGEPAPRRAAPALGTADGAAPGERVKRAPSAHGLDGRPSTGDRVSKRAGSDGSASAARPDEPRATKPGAPTPPTGAVRAATAPGEARPVLAAATAPGEARPVLAASTRTTTAPTPVPPRRDTLRDFPATPAASGGAASPHADGSGDAVRRSDTAPSFPAPLLRADATRTVTPTNPGVPALPSLDEAEEISADEVLEAEEPRASPPRSALNPWLAQLVHGYCPPEQTPLARPTPPTTFPGRDAPSPGRTPSEPELPVVSPGRPRG